MKWLRGIIAGFAQRYAEAYAREIEGEDHSSVRYAQQEYIDWSKVPEGYDWVCLDGYNDGQWMCKYKPHIYQKVKSPGWMTGYLLDFKALPLDAIIGPLPPWRESLRRRPK